MSELNDYWFCDDCDEIVEPCCVTNDECHDYTDCFRPVRSIKVVDSDEYDSLTLENKRLKELLFLKPMRPDDVSHPHSVQPMIVVSAHAWQGLIGQLLTRSEESTK